MRGDVLAHIMEALREAFIVIKCVFILYMFTRCIIRFHQTYHTYKLF